MSRPATEYLSELPHLGQAGQWAYDRIIALSIENAQLRQQLQEKEAKLQESQADLQRADEQLEFWQRQAHRQAALFRRTEQERNPNPGRPGRKPGHVGAYRAKPDHIMTTCTCRWRTVRIVTVHSRTSAPWFNTSRNSRWCGDTRRS